MNLDLPIRELMTPDPFTVTLEDALTDAYTAMVDRGFHHVPVVDRHQELLGLLSMGDLQRVIFGLSPRLRATSVVVDKDETVETMMTRTVVHLDADATLRDAAQQFAEGTFHSLPVLEGRRLIGILTTTDLVRRMLAE